MHRNNITVLGCLLWIFCSVDSITLPPDIVDTTLHADVSASSTCNRDDVGFTCNSTCPSRTPIPPFETPIQVKDNECKNVTEDVGQLLPTVAAPNGNVVFDNSTGNCTSISASTTPSAEKYFTLSLWVKHSCNNCTLFTIGSEFTFLSTRVVQNSWKHVAIQYNGAVSIFISGVFETMENPVNFSSGYDLTLGPRTVLATGEAISFVDVRWYADVLTDRDISLLANGTFQTLPTRSDCRCPPNAPSLVDPSTRYLICTDRSTNVEVPRLAAAHPPVYMVDGDPSTHWNSGNVTNVTITLTIGKLYQISRVILEGLGNVPFYYDLVLKHGSKISHTGRDIITSNILRNGTLYMNITDDEFTVTTRGEYDQLLADEVQLTLHSGGPETFYTVSEFKLVTRCACYGNAASCTHTTDLNYTCQCTDNTRGDHCATCVDEYYRGDGELGCTHDCNCNTTGAVNKSCEEVGGQCTCKPLVSYATRTCTECQHNAIGFDNSTVNGCTACTCNPSGIVECSENATCVCKANVEAMSGNCMACSDDYFGIQDIYGCSACECGEGTMQSGGGFQSCDKDTGQCPCKTNVYGRKCDECQPMYRDLSPVWPNGCIPCACSFVGSVHLDCTATGQCTCRGNVTVNKDCRPTDLHMSPDYGPVAGGTRVTITGHNLGGSNPAVTVISIGTAQQSVVERTDSSIIFTTHPTTDVTTSKVAVVWSDGGTAVYRDDVFEEATTFHYKPNPSITVPTTAFKTFASGGCSIDIAGHNLDSIPHPALLVHTANGTVLSQICTHKKDTHIVCPTPDTTQYLTNGSVSFGVRLDNIGAYEDFTASSPSISLVVIPDPIIETDQSASFRNTFDKDITITGRRLDEACLDSDFQILVGGEKCAIRTRSATAITCEPQDTFPGATRDEDVMVVIGDKTVYWGKVTFTEFWELKEFIYICVGVGGFILVVVVMIVLCCCCRRRRQIGKLKARDSQLELVATPPGRTINQYVDLQSQGHTNPVALVSPLVSESLQTPTDITEAFMQRLQTNVATAVNSSVIERSQVEPGRNCTHKGKNIRIINGQFRKQSTSQFAGTSVNIKTLIKPYPEEGVLPHWLNNGLHECVRLRDSIHENVLRLMGVAIDAKHVYIIYPEMARRTLKDHIANPPKSFGTDEKLYCCVQVGEGMNFLDSDNFVHKDLAARNCWVDASGVVKIADASFSHDLYPDDYLYQNGRYQPVRWMAPESLKQSGFYHSKSDVWSYGVLMWEVFANGYTPYHDIENNSDVSCSVNEKGYRLGKPHGCSDEIYSVIEQCHNDISEDRPNFFLILNNLSEIISPGSNAPISYVNDPTEEQTLYINAGQLAGAVKLPPVPPRPKVVHTGTNPKPLPPRPKPKPIREKVN